MNAPPTSSMAKADSRPNGLSHPSRTSSFDSTSSDTAPIMRARSVRFSKTHRYCRRGLCDILHGGRGLRCVEPLPNSLPTGAISQLVLRRGKLWPTPLLGRCAATHKVLPESVCDVLAHLVFRLLRGRRLRRFLVRLDQPRSAEIKRDQTRSAAEGAKNLPPSPQGRGGQRVRP